MGIQKRNAEEFRFRRFELRGATSLASILEGGHTGIYILEFANGERYVGQSVDVRSRFTQHVHGSGHKPWTDVTAFAFLDVPAADLNRVERLIIETQRGLRRFCWSL
ncbi:GIY-YIG nuclease family protein [Corynebacterium vitaeruminis]|uniref:GIY-YIG nuclease family protein n=1 Tax=Corynebacterium vitaeruminis TaxID=38305 RepID=UPI0009DFE334